MNMKDKFKTIYKKLKSNSIGKEKKCKKVSEVKSIILKVQMPVLILTMLTSCGVSNNNDYSKNNSSSNSFNYSNYTADAHEYSPTEIKIYLKGEIDTMLDKYEMNEFTMENGLRSYSYSYLDYQKIDELNTEHIYAFYRYTTIDTTNEICKALSYKDLDTYLITSGYVDSNDKPDYTNWGLDSLAQWEKIMKSNSEGAKVK